MRNLKRILSAALALVMSMSIATVASAAVDFDDAADINYDEAVAVMSTIGVLEGYNGEFDPAGSLTREQAAKIIAYMLLGDNANKLSVADSRYTDVAANRWSAGVIEYCSEMGILAGNGDGTYNPEGKLTGYAFAKMLLGALGYKSDIEGFTGAAWTLNVANYAMQIGLDNGIEDIDWAADITREQAAQMAMNAVKSPLVQYKEGATIIIDGQKVTFGSGDAYYVTSTLAKEQRISTAKLTNSNEYTVEFGERYFPGLSMTSDEDAFERPSHTWSYNNSTIGTYVDYDTRVDLATTSISGKDMYDMLGKTVIEKYDLAVYVDGYAVKDVTASEFTRTNSRNLAHTGNGVLTEVFVDHDAEEITITMINTYMAEATADYNEKTDKLTLDVYAYNKAASVHALDMTTDSPMEVLGEDFAVENYKEGDLLLVNIGKNEIQIIGEPEVVSETKLSAFSKDSKVVAGGETYNYAVAARYDVNTLDQYDDQNLAEALYNIYLDPYGYLVGIELVEDASTYVFITGYNMKDSNTAYAPATATAIFPDGKMASIDVNVEDSDFEVVGGTEQVWSDGNGVAQKLHNTWYSYKVNSNNVYTLDYVENQAVTKYSSANGNERIDRGNIALNGVDGTTVTDTLSTVVYGNADTQYVTVGLKNLDNYGIISKVKAVNTGIKNTDLTVYSNGNAKTSTSPAVTSQNYASGVYGLYNDQGYVIAAIVVGRVTSSSENSFYALSDVNYEEYTDGKYYWSVKGIMNGVETTVRERGDWGDLKVLANVKKGDLFTLGFDSEGYVVEKTAITIDGGNTVINAVPDSTAYQTLNNAYLHVEGWTLYLTQANTNGIVVADECPTALVETIDGKTVVTYYNDVKTAVKSMQDSTDVDGKLVATLDSKKNATSIIIIDDDAQGFIPGARSDGTATGTVKLDGLTLNVYKRAGDSLDVLAAAEAYFGNASIDNIRPVGGEFELTVGNKTYITNTVTLQPITLATSSGTIAPTTVYLSKGESVVVTITSGGNWSQANANSLADDSANATISNVSGVGTKTISFKLDAGADYTVAKTINISWS